MNIDGTTGDLAAADSPRREVIGLAPGSKVGPYTLRSVLGEGGFGVVYAAEQTEPVKRRVALKVIKPGMDSQAVIARFEQEQQALAVMDHPNVARVLDAGTTDRGLPFFAMEYVKGEPITDYCDRHNLPLRDRLELYIPVCEAVQHAHMKGIIHRDIKPSNVLVAVGDVGPIVKVIDFGVAKALSHTLTQQTIFTEHGQLIGTPEYMSPEQAEMGATDIDTRTDVYSLGVLLYELLTGATPFESKSLRGAGYDEIRRIIREVDPPKPSTRFSSLGEQSTEIARRRQAKRHDVARELSRELDWIPLKAMRKDRIMRYRTATDLADDIQRYLRGEPLEAGPESTTYRIRKYVRRHRGPVAAVVTIVLILFAGIVGTATFAIRAHAAAERAILAEAEAEQRAADLEKVAEFQATQLSGIETDLMGVGLRRSILEQRRASLEARNVDEEAIGKELAELELSLAGVNFTNIALESLKENIFDRAIAAIEEQFSDQPLVKGRLLQTVASTMVDLGLFAPAEQLQEEALKIHREHLGDEHRNTLASINNMGVLLRIMGRYDDAFPLLEEALKTRRRVLGDGDPDTLASMNDMADLLRQLARFDEARELYVKAIDGRRRALGDEHEDTLTTILNLGAALYSEGKHADASQYFLQALEGFQRTMGDDSPYTLAVANNLAMVLQYDGRSEEAREYLVMVAEGLRKSLGDLHPHTLTALSNLAMNLHYDRQYAEAVAVAREAVDGSRIVLGNDHPQTAMAIENLTRSLHWLGHQYRSEGQVELTLSVWRESLELCRELFGDEHNDTMVVMSVLGFQLAEYSVLLQRENRLADAESALLEAIDLLRISRGENYHQTLDATGLLVKLYEAWHEAAPEGGYDAKAAKWQEKLPEVGVKVEPVHADHLQ